MDVRVLIFQFLIIKTLDSCAFMTSPKNFIKFKIFMNITFFITLIYTFFSKIFVFQMIINVQLNALILLINLINNMFIF